jgi:hypothetical protein
VGKTVMTIGPATIGPAAIDLRNLIAQKKPMREAEQSARASA